MATPPSPEQVYVNPEAVALFDSLIDRWQDPTDPMTYPEAIGAYTVGMIKMYEERDGTAPSIGSDHSLPDLP